MNFKKSNLLFFTLLMIVSFFFTKNALAYTLCTFSDGSKNCEDQIYVTQHPNVPCSGNYSILSDCKKFETSQSIFWYVCPVAGTNKIYTCANSQINSGCSVAQNTKDICLSAVAALGGTIQDPVQAAKAASQVQTDQQALIDKQLQANQAEIAKQAAEKKALEKESLLAASLMCDCSKNGGQCKDDFTSQQEANDYCTSCGLPPPAANASSVGCPLGSKEIGPFHCSCGSGDKAVCSTFDTYSELKTNCAKTCGSGNGPCPVDISASLKNLQKAALALNPAGFAFGSAGVTEIVGKMIIFLMFPIGMFAMIMYIWAGFLWMTAQGNSENVSKAKTIIVWTTLGIVATMASYIIVQFIFTQLL